MMIIYIAGLNNVSPDLVEAAQIDGATSRQILFKIKTSDDHAVCYNLYIPDTDKWIQDVRPEPLTYWR